MRANLYSPITSQRLRHRLRRTLLGALLLVAPTCFSLAQEQEREPLYLDEYAKYESAVAANDHALAEIHVRQAWESAERTIGDHPVTGALAYIYGRHAILSDVEGAHPALERAMELHEAGVVKLPEVDLKLYTAYADLIAGRFLLPEASRMEDVLEEMRAQEPNDHSELSHLWYVKATTDKPISEVLLGINSVTVRAERYLTSRPAQDLDVLLAVQFRGATSVLSMNRSIDKLHAAYNDFSLTCSWLWQAETLDDYEPLMATGGAWAILALKMAQFIGYDEFPESGPNADFDHSRCLWRPKTYATDLEKGCVHGSVVRRTAFTYPGIRRPGDFFYVVYYGFQLDENLQVAQPVVLAEAPKQRHGDAVLLDLSRVKYASDGDEPICRRDIIGSWGYARK